MLSFARLGKILAVATVVCLCLLIAEYAARFFLRDVTTTSHDSYLTRRWERTVRKNSWGFREREVNTNKAHGIYRIAVIGDSITFGQGIDVEQRFTNILEKHLNAHDSKYTYEVLNFGRRGAETVDEVKFLTHPVLEIKPDFVLLQWFHNDVEGSEKAMRPAPYRLIPSNFLTSVLQRNSLIFHLLNQHWITLQWRLGWLQSYADYMRTRFGDPDSPPSRAAKVELEKFLSICKKSNIPVGVLLFNPDSTFSFLADRVLDQCKKEAILCLDLGRTFAQHPPDWASTLDPHPGPSANQLIAARLLQIYGEIWSKSGTKGKGH